MEIALLHALPVADDIRTPSDLPHKFSFPSQVTIPQQYRLLGNSLNVRVVSRILGHLFAAELGRDPVPYGQEAREALLP